MKCPLCGAWATKLETRSRATDNTVRRRYECGNLHRFSTVERVVPSLLKQPRKSAQTPTSSTEDSPS
jgi:transcriptional regulator NrdR family protein